jgi:hypothetical protein
MKKHPLKILTEIICQLFLITGAFMIIAKGRAIPFMDGMIAFSLIIIAIALDLEVKPGKGKK